MRFLLLILLSISTLFSNDSKYSIGLTGSSYVTGGGISLRLYNEDDSFWQFNGFGAMYEESDESDVFDIGVTYNRYFYESNSGAMRFMGGVQYFYESWEDYHGYGESSYDRDGELLYSNYYTEIETETKSMVSAGFGIGFDFFGRKREEGFLMSADTFIYGEYSVKKEEFVSAGIGFSLGLLYNF